MLLVDAHCHLGDAAFDRDRDAVLVRARAAGVGPVVVIGGTVAESERAAALARGGPGLSATAGVTPHEARSWSPEAAARLKALLALPEVVAVGETGLDYHYDHSPRPAQRRAFEAQLGLAAELGKPVVVHAREADDDVAAMLAAARVAVVLHSFSSGPNVFEAGMAIGAYFSFSGMITFKNWTTTANVPTDIAIAQAAKLGPIADSAAELGLAEDEVELYGKYKAKVRLAALAARKPKGRLVLVTGINPTPAGEGKSTVTVGVTQALRKLGKNAILAIREPSLGPVFGVKGGAAGGGYAQVVPMEDINLHFTGDFHAIATAHNLLSAMLDAQLHHGNTLGLDVRRIIWPRTIDMNDRALRSIIVGLGGVNGGPTREERFVIIPGSEVMAILALATGVADLEARLARVIVGLRGDKTPVRASDLKAQGAMTLLLKDALNPNLVQTLEGGPALVHCGPFGNIAHGCNSVAATRMGLALADLVVTEAGFGADLGAEKFFDIKCRMAGLNPEAAILVTTVRALKMHGGVKKEQLSTADPGAVRRGCENLTRHIRNVKKFGVPCLVALNRFTTDTDEEVEAVRAVGAAEAVEVVRCDVWEKGGEGGLAVAESLLGLLKTSTAGLKPLYDEHRPIREKIETSAREIYGAAGVEFAPAAERALELLPKLGLGETPVCMAKTQYSLTDDATQLGAPSGFTLHVRDILPSAGAGFVVALAGDILTMPGLGNIPRAYRGL